MSSQIGLKICLGNEIRKISKTPADLKGLMETITLIFGANLPKKWTLQYVDSDGDNVMLSDELDFKEFIEEGQTSLTKIVKKVYIIALAEQQKLSQERESQSEKIEIIQQKEVSKEDSFEVLTKEIEEPKSHQKDAEVLDEEEVVDEQVFLYGSNLRNQRSERRANKVVKKLTKYTLPEADKRLRGKLRELGKCLTVEQKEDLERKKDRYSGQHYQKIPMNNNDDIPQPEEFPSLNSASEKKIVHEGIRCDGCHQSPIVGIRYKCSKCADFDYCEGCEAKFDHPHPFIQMKKPEEKYSGSSSQTTSNLRKGVVQQKGRQIDRKWRPLPATLQSFIATFDNDEDEESSNNNFVFDENQHEKVSETIKRIYASEIQEKAQRLSEIFPERRPQEFYIFVSKANHLSLEALVEKWLLA